METPCFEIHIQMGGDAKLLIFASGKVEKWQSGKLIPNSPGEVIINRIPQLLAQGTLS